MGVLTPGRFLGESDDDRVCGVTWGESWRCDASYEYHLSFLRGSSVINSDVPNGMIRNRIAVETLRPAESSLLSKQGTQNNLLDHGF